MIEMVVQIECERTNCKYNTELGHTTICEAGFLHIDKEGKCTTYEKSIGVCPKCGSKRIHETELHECPSGGKPMRCSSCYHTWCKK